MRTFFIWLSFNKKLTGNANSFFVSFLLGENSINS